MCDLWYQLELRYAKAKHNDELPSSLFYFFGRDVQ